MRSLNSIALSLSLVLLSFSAQAQSPWNPFKFNGKNIFGNSRSTTGNTPPAAATSTDPEEPPPEAPCPRENEFQGRPVCRWANLEVESLQNRLVKPSDSLSATRDYQLIVKAQDKTLVLSIGGNDCGPFGCGPAMTALADCARMAGSSVERKGYLSFFAVFAAATDRNNAEAWKSMEQLGSGKGEAVVPLGNKNLDELGCTLTPVPPEPPPAPPAEPAKPAVETSNTPSVLLPDARVTLPSTGIPINRVPILNLPPPPPQKSSVEEYCEDLKQQCMANPSHFPEDCRADYSSCTAESNCKVRRLVCFKVGRSDDSCEREHDLCQQKYFP